MLRFIKTFIGEHGFSPSYDEIAYNCGLASKSNVSRIVDALLKQGQLRKAPGAHRNLEPTDPLTIKAEAKAPDPDRVALALIAARMLPLDQRAAASAVIAQALVAA